MEGNVSGVQRCEAVGCVQELLGGKVRTSLAVSLSPAVLPSQLHSARDKYAACDAQRWQWDYATISAP